MNKKFISLILVFVFLFYSLTMTVATGEAEHGAVSEGVGSIPLEEYEEMYEKIVIRGDNYFSYPASRETDIFGDLSREEIERILKGLAREAFIDKESICYPTNAEKEIFGDLSRERIIEITSNLFSVKKNKTKNVDKTSYELEEMITIYDFAKNTRDFSHEMNWQSVE